MNDLITTLDEQIKTQLVYLCVAPVCRVGTGRRRQAKIGFEL